VPAQLYNLDVVAYESLMLEFFCIWRGDPRLSCSKGSKLRPKINEVVLGYSRDGFHWYRPDRHAFIGVSEDPKSWRWGNVQSTGAGCLVVGDKLYVYFSGRGRSTRNKKLWQTGLAMLRRDGFVSMDAGAGQGSLVTRPILFTGKCLFVNANAKEGELRVEILDTRGNAIPPFTADRCVPVHSNSTLHHVQWQHGGEDLSALRNTAVKLRFVLRQARLYSFWVSPDESGASHGYVAGGGPGYTGHADTVGRRALIEEAQP